ncbi:Uridylate kinase|nr:Uridylate kinase [Neochlamydia sp. AcF84]
MPFCRMKKTMTNLSNAKRILLKLSGETLLGEQPFGVHFPTAEQLAISLKDIKQEGFELALVIGGGNIFRAIQLKGSKIPRSAADQMGMLATLMNGIALQQALTSIGCTTKLISALECPKVAESYNWNRTNDYLAAGHIVLFVGGTGNPYFTTDSAAALRACEIQADVLLKATKVKGVYTQDPLKFPQAQKYRTLSYSQYLTEKLEVMDTTSIALCMNNQLPIFVFSMEALGKESLKQILSKTEDGTLIS